MKLFYDFLGKLLLLLPLLNEHFVVKYMYEYNNYCELRSVKQIVHKVLQYLPMASCYLFLMIWSSYSNFLTVLVQFGC